MPSQLRKSNPPATGFLPPALAFLLILPTAWAQTDTPGFASRAAANGGTLILIGGAIALAVIGGWFMIMWRRREPIPRYQGGREVESSPYEQVAAELQGIKLRISSGDGRAYLPKVERLVHIFADRAGVIGARTMDREALTKALSAAPFSPEQIKTLARVLLQCERARTEESIKLDFDPMDMVKDFQSIVRELEREETA
jgi:hypothetical protein